MKQCWLILFCSTVSILLLFLNETSYGRTVIEVRRSFPTSKMATLMTTGSIFLLINCYMTPAALLLIKLYSPTYTNMITTCVYVCGIVLASCSLNEYQFMVAYGVIAGLGSISNRVGLFLAGRYFPPEHKFHIFATSWIQCIFPLAVMCTSISNVVISWLGWRLTYLAYSVAVFVTGIVTSVIYARNGDESPKETSKETTEASGCIKLCITCFIALNFCLAVFVNMPVYILPKYALDEGLSIGNGANLTAYFGTADLVCRLIFTVVGDRFLKGRLLYVYAVFSLAIATATCIFGLNAHTYSDFIVYSVIVGGLSGPLMAGQYAVCCELFHGLYAPEIYIAGTLSRGMAYMLSLYLCGSIYDWTGSFRGALVFFITLQVIAALLTACILILKKYIKV